jgi:hypothetical protein
MKILVGNEYGSYSFNPAAGTITLSGLPTTLRMEQILIITDLISNTIIYNFADPTAGAVSVTNNIITLEKNVTALNASDKLQIFIEIPDPNYDLINFMQRFMKLLESNGTVDSNNRQRIAVEAMPTTTVTGSVNIGTNASLVAGAALIGTVGTAQTINAANGNPYVVTAANVQSTQESPVDQRWRIVHEARNAFANGIRKQLN